ncbi:helix-turn-helix domain-containing protein [Actinophytocola xanthii]|uniref:AraC family transcriptional regulator n=1 Tax=Actinophytocola xanthii TaxID=1912961 RepID=A0A1Q8BWV7_9PSEU|nr:helix-turn-helix domain-containing protein [Actinophytocola xanthii]OLF06597.1 AraC family transcriptional regulator [Actinophytocola xanthii]
MTSVALVLYDGTMLFEAAMAAEVFGVDRSDIASPWYDLTIRGDRPDRLGDWVSVPAVPGYDGLEVAHTVVVPSLADVSQEPPAEVVAAVRAAHERGARVLALCTGAFVLAAAGLLDGRRATTHWAHADLLAARHPTIDVDPDVLYVDEGSVLTSAGKAAAMDLCLHVVRVDHGTAAANALARRLVVAPHRAGGQAQFVTAPVPEPGNPLDEVMHWAVEHLHEPLTVRELADRAGVSTRTLARQFVAATGWAPLRWLSAQRVRLAQELLETTDVTVESVAARTGMGSAATLRRHFRQALATSPDAYRRTFQGTRSADTRPMSP